MTRIERLRFVVHNLIAHPMLILWPRAGEWLHQITAPEEQETSDV